MALTIEIIRDSIPRRSFIAARMPGHMGSDEAMLVRLWREKRGEVEPEDLSDNLIVQLGTVTEDLNGACMSATPGGPSLTCNDGSSIRSSSGWRQRSMAWLIPGARCSRLSSCCPGHSRRRGPPKSTWPSCSTICGWPMPGPPFLSIVRRRQMGRGVSSCRSAVPSTSC